MEREEKRRMLNRTYQKNRYARLTTEEKTTYVEKVFENRKRRRSDVNSIAIATFRTKKKPKMTREEKKSFKRSYRKNRYAQLTNEQRALHIKEVSRNRKRRSINLKSLAIAQLQTEEIPYMTPEPDETVHHTVYSSTFELRKCSPCNICGAKKFEYEPPTFCCYGGKVVLAKPNIPDDLRVLFTSQKDDAVEFRRHIRAYNSMFSFTSFGVKLDKELASSRRGVYTFRAQGQIYHDLPPLVPQNNVPSYFQLYFFDTDNELKNRLQILRDAKLSEPITKKLMELLSENPYAQFLRRLQETPLDACEVRIRSDVQLDQRVYNSPSADQVAAIWIEGNNPTSAYERDIIVHAHSGHKHRVRHYYGCYDPLQYPLLFPRGDVGWHQNILKIDSKKASSSVLQITKNANIPSFTSAEDIFNQEQQGVRGEELRKVSCRQYYSYKLQIRDYNDSIILLSGRLLQQYVVDMYIKLETTRLDYYRNQQSKLRAELYQGIADSILAGEVRGSMVGKRIVLPSSFVGGPRDMRRRYLDAMALVQRFGKPDLFITMTCNSEWKEIQEELKEGQTAQDRPDLTARIFRAKLHDLKEQLVKKQIFGKVAAYVYVIEFQKRGLPHAHILLILKSQYKITSSDSFDNYVCAEIPDVNSEPDLHEKVVRHMMHGPCGEKNPKNACMREGKCKNRYPRPFCPETVQGEDSYPIYKRRNDKREVFVRRKYLDNSWVVPYNPFLLTRYDCHLNVEICSGIQAVKYLYKYIYKGHDKVAVHIARDEEDIVIDEIHQFQDARWVSAQEAMWRIFEFDLNEMHPAVINLQLHLPNKQCVSYWENQNLENLLCSDVASRTMLTEFFKACSNEDDKEAKTYLYREFPEHYVWNKKGKYWSKRKSREVIGRVNGANPSEGERYYLRLLLNHVRGPTSFLYLLTYNGVQYHSFKEAAAKRGLLQSHDSISECLHEAAHFQMPKALRRLFAIILVYCEPKDVRNLWDIHFSSLSEDFLKMSPMTDKMREWKTWQGVDFFLESMGRSITEYDLPTMDSTFSDAINREKREILDQLAISTPPEDLLATSSLNPEQQVAFDIIMDRVNSNGSGAFFIDGPGGTGKTYLYQALLATVRSRKLIAIATATSGVAASLLPGGQTTHSTFKIPIDANETSVCSIPKQSGRAELLRRATLIIWDEAPMAKQWSIEAVDRSLKDIMGNDKLFGGKIFVFGGDFRQVLPVVPRSTRAENVNASLVKSHLWLEMEKLKLSRNMRASSDATFSDFLLRVGNGDEPCIEENMVKIPNEMLVTYANKNDAENCLINTIFPSIEKNCGHAEYITNRAILATTNETVDMLNKKIISIFPGEVWTYRSYDVAVDDTYNYYPEEFLNSLTPNGFPPHKLDLKVNSPIMLLRNLDPSEGLCNGTRMVCRGFEPNVIHAEIALGQFAGKPVLLPRIPLLPPEDGFSPFIFKRTQFPVRSCFAMTINKAQGQTIPHVGVYLPQPVFSHGQLYVALSRGTSMSTTKVLLKSASQNNDRHMYTRNLVYKEVLTS